MIDTCEFCGSKDVKVETSFFVANPFYTREFHRIKCCNCGKILSKDYKEDNINVQTNSNCMVIGNRVWINGEELPPAPTKGNSVTTIDGKVYIDGYEFKKGKWRRTLKALLYLWF
jgi:hypothetical protein